jgi:voltage-gated potassium channel
MEKKADANGENLTVFQLVIFLLSILVLGALIIDTVAPVPQEVSKILQVLDIVVCGLFLIDFVIRFSRAESKRKFMKWGWIDLVASIPNIDLLRVGRLARILRIIRLFRGVRAGQKVISLVLQNRPKSAVASVILSTLLLVSFSSIAILVAEGVPEANIKTAEDSIWWSITTMTTVGYGDRYPITTEGRMIAIVLMFSGVGLFGTISGLIASVFLGNVASGDSEELRKLLIQTKALNEKLEKLSCSKEP